MVRKRKKGSRSDNHDDLSPTSDQQRIGASNKMALNAALKHSRSSNAISKMFKKMRTMLSVAPHILMSLVLLYAITYSVDYVHEYLFWRLEDEEVNRMSPDKRELYNYLKDFVCNAVDPVTKEKNGYCHPALLPNVAERTHSVMNVTGVEIKSGEILMVLPRHLLITDFDAISDPYVYENLLGAHHDVTAENLFIEELWPGQITRADYIRDNDYRTAIKTLNNLDAGAFLAAYLVRRYKLATHGWKDTKNDNILVYRNGDKYGNVMDPLLPFFKILPTYEELEKNHPTLWPDYFLKEQFGEMSNVMQQIYAFRDMIIGEYRGLCKKSFDFCANVSPREYKTFRINVMSRAFGMGTAESGAVSDEEMNASLFTQSDIENLKDQYDIDLNRGVRAMAPILDMWDHHPNAASSWQYKAHDKAFVISATKSGFKAGDNIMVSYGKYTETHLFCKFGFNNGDGSGFNEASIAVHHRQMITGLEPQFSYRQKRMKGKEFTYRGSDDDVLKYLQYDDDGVPYCTTYYEDRWKFKGTKLLYLKMMVQARHRWMISMAPKNMKVDPPPNSRTPPLQSHVALWTSPKFFRGKEVQKLAQFIGLSMIDYEGKAYETISKHLSTGVNIGNFTVDISAFIPDAMNYRSYHVMNRLFNTMTAQYPNSLADEKLLVERLTRENYQSREWLAACVRLSELETLHLLSQSSVQNIFKVMTSYESRGYNYPALMKYGFFIRDKPCPSHLNYELNDIFAKVGH